VQLRELLDNPGFRTGLGAGVAVLLVVLVVVGVRTLRRAGPTQGGRAGHRTGRGRLPPLAGIAVVVAAGIAMVADGTQTLESRRLVVGLVLLVVGPFAVSLASGDTRAARVLAMLAAVPGAAVVAWAATAVNDLPWIPWLVLAATVVGGALVVDLDRANARAGLGPVLLAVTVLGMYSTLPDTEQIVVVVGVALPFVLLGFPFALASLGPGAYVVVGLTTWIAAVGGRGRPGSVIAAIACLGLFLVEPFVRRASRGRLRSPRNPRSATVVWIVTLQVPLVLVIARVAGLRTSARSAAAISALALAVAAAGLAAVLAAGSERVRGRMPASEPAPSPRRTTFSAGDDRPDGSAS